MLREIQCRKVWGFEMIFESHAHYDDEAFDGDRHELLSSLREHGIDKVINVGASLDSCKKTLKLMEQYPFMYGAMGVHPGETAELNEENFAWLSGQCAADKVVAVGEIGLDYHWPEPEAHVQKLWFERQLELAKKVKLPVIIHSREAAKDTLDMMRAMHARETGGVIHCYSYTKELAREYLQMDFFFGIGGVITFKNAKKLKEAVEYIPLDRILLETDSPYLAPEPNRGKRNSSLNLSCIAQAVAELKRVSYEDVVEATCRNAEKLFNISG